MKVQSSFTAVQLLGIVSINQSLKVHNQLVKRFRLFFLPYPLFSLQVVDVSYCIAIYTLYFVNYYPFDQFVQQDLNAFEKHRYDMQDLLNALTYTLMSLIPLTLLSRVAVIYFGLHTRSFFIYIVSFFYFYLSYLKEILLILNEKMVYQNPLQNL